MISRAAFERIWKMEFRVRSLVVNHTGKPMVLYAQCVFIWFSRAWSTHEYLLAALSDNSWAFLPLCHSSLWVGVKTLKSVFFSSAWQGTEKGGGLVESTWSIFLGTYLILKNRLLSLSGIIYRNECIMPKQKRGIYLFFTQRYVTKRGI